MFAAEEKFTPHLLRIGLWGNGKFMKLDSGDDHTIVSSKKPRSAKNILFKMWGFDK